MQSNSLPYLPACPPLFRSLEGTTIMAWCASIWKFSLYFLKTQGQIMSHLWMLSQSPSNSRWFSMLSLPWNASPLLSLAPNSFSLPGPWLFLYPATRLPSGAFALAAPSGWTALPHPGGKPLPLPIPKAWLFSENLFGAPVPVPLPRLFAPVYI